MSILIVAGFSGIAAAQIPASPPPFERQLFAGQLGEISALALGEEGSVFAADISRGVIYRFADRGRDGRLDSRQVIASNFERPSGLAVVGARVFVSDARAIWEVNPRGGDVRHLASLTKSRALTAPRPLYANAKDGSLIIGLTDRGGATSKLVSVDITTGVASLLASGFGQIDALAGQSDVWAASGSAIFPIHGQTYNAKDGAVIEAGTHISGLVLPTGIEALPGATAELADYIFTSARPNGGQSSFARADNLKVYGVPTQFGKPSGAPLLRLIDDIPASRNRGRSLYSGTMVMDERGIFLADSAAGSVWRLVKAKPKLRRSSPAKLEPSDQVSPSPKAELNPKGSGLTSASQIKEGATLKVGSTIPEDDDDEKENGDLEKDRR